MSADINCVSLETAPHQRVSCFAGAAAVLLFCALLTLFGTLTLGSGPVHPDMTEAWAWGKEFQLGYDKHPPFAAWVAGAWLSVMPRTDCSFYLLASINAGAGLVGVWWLASLLLGPRDRWVAVLLLVLTPYFTFWALKFNANAPLLSTWPWATYFFVRSLLTHRLAPSALAGAICGMALLTKYSSVVLFAAMLLAALSHPNRFGYFRSLAPAVTVWVALAVFAPHIWWAVQADFPTVKYAASKTHFPFAMAKMHTISATLGSIAAGGIALAACGIAYGTSMRPMLATLRSSLSDRSLAWLAVLAVAPFLITIATNVLANVRVSSGFLFPVFFAVPIAFLALSHAPSTDAVVRRLCICVMAVWLPLLLAAPFVDQYAVWAGTPSAAAPTKDVAVAATKVWRATFGQPLRYVAGTRALATAATFYSPDAPSLVVFDDPSGSPWTTPAMVAQHGLLIICRASDAGCIAHATAMAGHDALRYWDRFKSSGKGGARAEHAFLFTLLPPANAVTLWD